MPAEQMAKGQIRQLVLTMRDLAAQLAEADPELRAEVYEVLALGVNVVYDQDLRGVRVGEGT